MWRTTLNASWLDEIVYKNDCKDNTKKVVIWVMIVSPKLYSLKFSLIMNNNRISENCLSLIIKCRIYRFNLRYIKNRKKKQKKKNYSIPYRLGRNRERNDVQIHINDLHCKQTLDKVYLSDWRVNPIY